MKISNFFSSSVKLISNDFYKDKRGYFSEIYKEKSLHKVNFVQDNLSFNKHKGTLRGLHFQKPPFDQAKYIHVLSGKIFDVVVDLRKASKTYGKYKSFILSEKQSNSLFISSGFAHGFLTLTDNVKLLYKVSNYYSKRNDMNVNWEDPNLNINWPLNSFNKLIISNKDKNSVNFEDLKSPF